LAWPYLFGFSVGTTGAADGVHAADQQAPVVRADLFVLGEVLRGLAHHCQQGPGAGWSRGYGVTRIWVE